jgi:hypothetical protein
MATETKASVADKLGTQLKIKNEKIKELELRVIELEKLNNNLKKEVVVYKTDEDVTKKILSYYAQGYQYSVILDKMRFNSYELEVEDIKNICLNIEDLEPEIKLYYRKQVKSYEEDIKINSDVLKDSLVQKYQFLYNEASMDLVNVGEVEERRKIREEMNKHLDKLNNVLKNVVDDKDSPINKKEEVDKSMANYSKTNIMSFSGVKRRAD